MNKYLGTDQDLGSNGFPLDWAKDITFRGVSRATAARRYLVRLSVLGTQFSIATASSQLKAARIYDVALWKLAALVSRTLRPNFPESFDEITQAKVDELSPNLNRIYSECAAAARLSDDATEREHRELALTRTVRASFGPDPGMENYGRYGKLVSKMRALTTLTLVRLSGVRQLLSFAKLPEIARVAQEYESLLSQAEVKGHELQNLLTGHAEFYKKLLGNKDTAI